jgi:hypothetical protein
MLMVDRQIKRVERMLTDAERARVQQYRDQIAAELPELHKRDQMRKEAREEATLSGELRRAVHASDRSLAEIASAIGVGPLALDEFLTGERTLRSDVLDRLAVALQYVLQKAPSASD